MSLTRSIGRNTLFTALGRSAVLFVWFLVTPTVLDALGADRFGFWSILLVLSGTLATLDLGLGVAIMRFVGEIAERGAAGVVFRLVARALALQVLLAGALAVLGLLFREPILEAFHIPAAWTGEARAALTLALISFVLTVATNLLVAALQGLQRMALAALALGGSAIFLGGVVLVAARQPAPLLALVVAQVAFGALQFVLLSAALFRAVRGLEVAPQEAISAGQDALAVRDVSLRKVIRAGSWLQASSVLVLLQQNVDKILLGTLVALAPVAAYEIAFRVSSVGLLFPVYFLGALLPVLARQQAVVGEAARLSFYRASLVPYLSLSLAMGGILFALAPSVLEAWLAVPPEGSVFMLRCLIVAGVANLATGIASTVVRATDRMDIEVVYLVALVLLHLFLSYAGFRLFGWPGILYGLVLAGVATALGFVTRVEAWLGVRPLSEIVPALLPGLLAAVVAGLSAAGIALLFEGLPQGRARGSLATAAGGLAYAIAFAGVLAVAFPVTFRSLAERARVVLRG
ncbi:MAG: oligosaccharide flippase family protein [Candidatus Eiseniibacteriota bacterium]